MTNYEFSGTDPLGRNKLANKCSLNLSLATGAYQVAEQLMNVSGGGELEDDLEVLAAGQPVERDRTGEVSFAEPDVGSLINKERKGSSSRK